MTYNFTIVKGHLNDVKWSHLPMQPEPIRKYEEHRNVSSDVRDEPCPAENDFDEYERHRNPEQILYNNSCRGRSLLKF